VSGHGDGWRRSEVEDGPDRWAPPVSRLERERERRGVRRASSWDEKRERLREGEGVVRRPAVAAAKEKKRERLDGPKENLGFN
jgi:hypothetical protein